MGHIKDIANQPNRQTFPGSTFEIQGEVPAAQCSEALIEGTGGITTSVPSRLQEVGKFTGFNLVGKVCTITATNGGNLGDFDITANDNNTVTLLQDAGDSTFVTYHVHDGGALILTRNAQSFAAYLDAHSIEQSSHTGIIVNGQPFITDAGKFPHDYSNLPITVINIGPPDAGTFTILSNTIDVLTTDHVFNANWAQLNYQIFRPQPHPHTIKGGKLYTSIPSAQLQNACTILFAPLT